eukprot:1144701-Pelagomonas_calceolata.AAC.3
MAQHTMLVTRVKERLPSQAAGDDEYESLLGALSAIPVFSTPQWNMMRQAQHLICVESPLTCCLAAASNPDGFLCSWFPVLLQLPMLLFAERIKE